MPTTEKIRYVRSLLGEHSGYVTSLDVEAVAKIWGYLTAEEKSKIRSVIERLIPEIRDDEFQARVRKLIQ
jgi:hypothetical protein